MKNPLLEAFGMILKSEKPHTGISLEVLRKFENASRIPNTEHSLKLSKALNVKFTNLIGLLEFCKIVGFRFDSEKNFLIILKDSIEYVNDYELKSLLSDCYRIFLEIDHYDHKVYRMQLAFRDFLKQERSFGSRRSYVTRFATREEIPEIQRKRAEMLPSISSELTPDKLLKIFDVNPTIVTRVLKTSGEDLGFFILYPLTADGVGSKIASCKEGNEKPIGPEHIASSFHDATGIWIAMIAGSEGSRNRVNSGIVINAMFEVCGPLFSSQTIECVMTRAVSKEGKAFLNRRGFDAILSNKGEVCQTSIASVTPEWLDKNGLKTVPHSFI